MSLFIWPDTGTAWELVVPDDSFEVVSGNDRYGWGGRAERMSSPAEVCRIPCIRTCRSRKCIAAADFSQLYAVETDGRVTSSEYDLAGKYVSVPVNGMRKRGTDTIFLYSLRTFLEAYLVRLATEKVCRLTAVRSVK